MKPDLRNICVEAFTAFEMIPKERREKLYDYAVGVIFIGYIGTKKKYLCYDQRAGTEYYTSDVIFYKSIPYYWKKRRI